jgi:ABC-type sugar transport system ATPase subunit
LIARTTEVLKTFHHADIRPDKRVSELSVAARQIVEISRAIAARARIILMDEPTSSLQRDDVSQLFTLIRKLSSEGISVVYIVTSSKKFDRSRSVYGVERGAASPAERLPPPPTMN